MILHIILYDIIRYYIILHMIYLRKRLGASGKTMVGEKQWLASLCRSMLPADTTPATNAPARCAHHLNLNHRSGARSKLNGRTIQHIRSTVPYSQGCRYSTRNDADIPRLKTSVSNTLVQKHQHAHQRASAYLCALGYNLFGSSEGKCREKTGA